MIQGKPVNADPRDDSMAAAVKDLLKQYATALHDVRLLKLQASSVERATAYDRSERNLQCIVSALSAVQGYTTAASSLEQLKLDWQRFRPSGWTHPIDTAIAELVALLQPFAIDPGASARVNAVRLIQNRINADDLAHLRQEMSGRLSDFASSRHMDVGLAIRNLLRHAGFRDSDFGADLDRVWAELLWDATQESA